MFWRFGFHQQSALDALLERPDFTLEELLAEEDLLQECKTMNRRLIDYLCKPETIAALFKIITDDPPADLDETAEYRLPNIASELLTCEVPQLVGAMLEHEDLLADFWKFLQRPAPLNPLHGSFFSRVIGALLQMRPNDTIEFIKKQDKAVETLLTHISTSAIMDIVLKLIAAEQSPQVTGVITWLRDEGLIKMLASKFDPELEPEVHANASLALVDIMNTTQTIQKLHLIMGEIKSAEVVELTLNHMLNVNGKHHLSVLQHGLSFLTDVLQRSLGVGMEGAEREDLTEFMIVVEPRVPALYELVAQEYPVPGDLAYTSYATSKHLGSMRFRLVEFFTALMHTCPTSVHEQLLRVKMVPTFVDLFFEFPLNNFLHAVVHDLVVKMLGRETDIMDQYIAQLFGEAHFIERLLDAYRQNEADSKEAHGVRRGYMGHLTLLANRLVKFSERDDLPDAMREHFNSPAWKEFERTTLADTNDADNRPLGGYRPVAATDPATMLEEMAAHDSSSGDQFARFMSHQLTGDLPSNFAAADDDLEPMAAEYEQDDGSFSRFGAPRFSFEAHAVTYDDSDDEDDGPRPAGDDDGPSPWGDELDDDTETVKATLD